MGEREHESHQFVSDPEQWSPPLAQKLADQEHLGPLSDEHWRVINYLREHYLTNKTLPVMKLVCHELDLEEGCVGRLFSNPEVAWRVAGLPDPGEEAKAYMESSEMP